MIDFNIIGRLGGLGNRIEEIILIDAYSTKKNLSANYVWTNIWRDRFKKRYYDIKLTNKNVKISKDRNEKIPIKTIHELISNFTQEEILRSAKNIKPTFKIHFENEIKPIGVHIRGTDKISKKGVDFNPSLMNDKNEFICYVTKTIELINKKSPKYIFVCSDDNRIREIFIDKLNENITVINPVYDINVEKEYVDFFALSLCKEIYMCAKFSSFSIIASLIGNIPLIAFTFDRNVSKKYKALFQYELNIPLNNKLFESIAENFSLSIGHHIRDALERLLIKCRVIH